MKKRFILIFLFLGINSVIAGTSTCQSKIEGFKVVKNSIYPFLIDNKVKACFFAFYIRNPYPYTDTKGGGNIGDALWYGYYEQGSMKKIYEFPKPSVFFWNAACELSAVSFIDINGDGARDVTVISNCNKQNVTNYTFPFVFLRKDNRYILDEDIYRSLFGFIALTVADIRSYIKSPGTQHEYLRTRYARELS